jgi:long-chain acyl-CoA synthetase
VRNIEAERQEIDRAIAGHTLCSVFEQTAARRGAGDALVVGASKLSWTEYRERVREVALGLHALGFARGEFGVMLARNRPEHVIFDLGVVHAGGTPVSLYTTLAPEQIEYIAGHCDARVAFVENATFLARLEAVRGNLKQLAHVVLLEGSAPGCLSWDELLARGRDAHAKDPRAFDALWKRVQPDDAATLIYTSGTTGHPKGVIDTHRAVLWDLTSLRCVTSTGDGDRIISYLPLAHAADRVLSHYASIVSGHTIYFCPDVTQILQTMVEVRPTFFGAVPRIWEKLHAGINAGIAKEPDDKKRAMLLGALEVSRAVVACEQRGEAVPDDLRAKRAAVEPVFAALRAKVGLDQAKVTVTGAAPTPREVLDFFHAIGVRINEVWGMSELACIASINPPERIKLGTIGVALPGVELRLQPDGELEARGGMVMKGYYKQPDTTAETIDRDGWLATGDVATVLMATATTRSSTARRS